MNTRAIRGADCSTDDTMPRSKIAFTIKKRNLQVGAKPPTKLNVTKVKDKEGQKKFGEQMDKTMDKLEQSEVGIEDWWSTLRITVLDTATDFFGATIKETPRLVCHG